VPYTSRDMVTISKTGPTIAMGSANAQGSKAKPVESGQSRLEQPERGTKRHKGWPIDGASGEHRGDPASANFISESRPRGFLHAPLCGLASSRLGFLLGLPGKDT
jgi:hypothetical protein